MIAAILVVFGFGALAALMWWVTHREPDPPRLDPYKAGRIAATHTMLQACMMSEEWAWAQRIIDNDPYDCVWPGIKEIVRQHLEEATPCLPPS